jgi:hypothetical protein
LSSICLYIQEEFNEERRKKNRRKAMNEYNELRASESKSIIHLTLKHASLAMLS